MSKQIVLRSFTELADYFGVPAPAPTADDSAAVMVLPATALEVAAPPIGIVLPENLPISPNEIAALPVPEPADSDTGAAPEVLDCDGTGIPAQGVAAVTVVNDDPDVSDVTALLADLEAAGQALAAAMRRDREVRAAALRGLEEYDAAVAARTQAEDVCSRAVRLRRDAEALVESAFADGERTAAADALAVATRAEEAARRHAERCQAEADALVERLDLQRALAERTRAEAAEKERAAQAERARRLSAAVADAREAIDAGQLAEAQALLGPLTKDYPDSAEIASLLTIIGRLRASVKATAAEDALWAARREYRHDPDAAVARLASLDVDGLPEPLARQIFGQWARACRRRCERDGIADALRYAPRIGRGSVLVRGAAGEPYVVLTAIGMGDTLAPGTVVSEQMVRCARPLSSC